MKRLISLLSAALILLALAFVLFQPGAARTARAADINERCNDCTIRNAERFNQCIAQFGENEQRCYDQYNQGVVICFREFCEQ